MIVNITILLLIIIIIQGFVPWNIPSQSLHRVNQTEESSSSQVLTVDYDVPYCRICLFQLRTFSKIMQFVNYLYFSIYLLCLRLLPDLMQHWHTYPAD